MTARFLNSTAVRDIKPGDKIECFGEWYWVNVISIITGRRLLCACSQKMNRYHHFANMIALL